MEQGPADARVRALFDHDENQKRFKRIQQIQKQKGLSLNQIVLGYLVSQPFPVFPIVGPKTLSDLGDILGSAESDLDPADIVFLEAGVP